MPVFTIPLVSIYFSAISSIHILDEVPPLFPDSVLNFEVSRNGNQIGNLKATATPVADFIAYSVHSNIEAKLLVSIDIQVITINYIRHQRLISCSTRRTVNGTAKLSHGLEYLNGKYLSKGKESLQGNLPGIISFTTTLLYFHEPVNVREVYSETHRCMVPLLRLSNGGYRIKLPDGKHTDYNYAAGKLTSVEANSRYGKIQMVKK